ncbi:MAG: hypothetical protein U9P14_10705, partial [Gemmatimonadota bacterium]|nr:hypothetical protein [Gemmatimonadota bacterium]
LQVYVLSTRGEGPVDISVHRLSRDFIEEEVTWEKAADAENWSSPGGDYESAALGSAEYEGGSYDTVSVDLDIQVLQDLLDGGGESLSLVLLSSQEEVVIRMLAGEIDEQQPIASLLSVVFSPEPGSSDTLLFERRAADDATIVHYEGQVSTDRLVVGELPASQVFFSFDFSGLPSGAMVNQALLHLSVSGGAVVDSFLVTAFATDNAEYYEGQGDLLTVRRGGTTENDSVLVLDLTRTVQLIFLQEHLGQGVKYFGLASSSTTVPAGFLEFYPDSWPESRLCPYMEMVYTLPGDSPLPD